jgi:hypothetical protein
LHTISRVTSGYRWSKRTLWCVSLEKRSLLSMNVLRRTLLEKKGTFFFFFLNFILYIFREIHSHGVVWLEREREGTRCGGKNKIKIA